MRGPHSRQFGRGLDGLGQSDRIVGGGDPDPCTLDQPEQLVGRRLRVDADRPLKPQQRRGKAAHRQDGHFVAQMRAQVGVEARGVGEQRDMAVVAQDRKGLHGGIARHVRAADVEKPSDGIGLGQHGGALALAHKLGRDPRAAFLRRGADKIGGVDADRAARRIGPVVPDRVHRVLDRDQRDRRRGQTFLQPLDLASRVKPRIEPDPAAARQRLEQPVRRRGLGPGHRGQDGRVGLGPDLHAVAAVDEQPGAVGGDDGKARAARKPGEPAQPGVAVGHVFALERVGAGHDHGIKVLFGHQRPQRRDPRGGRGRVARGGEVLPARRARFVSGHSPTPVSSAIVPQARPERPAASPVANSVRM